MKKQLCALLVLLLCLAAVSGPAAPAAGMDSVPAYPFPAGSDRSGEDGRSSRPALSIDAHPADVTTSPDSTATFWVSVYGSAAGLTYQWQVRYGGMGNWYNLDTTGSLSNFLSVPAGGNFGNQYRCVLTRSDGQSVTSEYATLKQNFYFLSNLWDIYAADGETVRFSVTVTGYRPTYRWEERDVSSPSWHTAAQGDQSWLTVRASPSTFGREYRCVVQDGFGAVITSYPASLYAKQTPAPKPAAKPAQTTAAPAPAAGSPAAVSSFSFRAIPESGDQIILFWNAVPYASSYRITVSENADSDPDAPSEATGNTYIRMPLSGTAGTRYYRLLTGGGQSREIAGTSVTRPGASGGSGMDVAAGAGEWITFIAPGVKDAVSWQWQERTSPEAQWNNVSQSGSASCTFVVGEAQLGCQYRCVIRLKNGKTAESDVIALRRK